MDDYEGSLLVTNGIGIMKKQIRQGLFETKSEEGAIYLRGDDK